MIAGPVYDSARRPGLRERVASVLEHRELVALLAEREVESRFGGTMLGALWTLATPLAYAALLATVFSQVHAFTGTGVPFVAYVLSGVIVLTFATTAILSVANAVVANRVAMRRVFVPVWVFAAATALVSLIMLTLSTIALLVVEVVAGVSLPWTIALLPIPFLLLALAVTGFGMFVGAFATVFTDTMEATRVLMTLLGFATPIFYPVGILPGSIRWIVLANPLYRFVSLFRDFAYAGAMPSAATLATCVGTPLLLLAAGIGAFAIVRRAFPTVL